MNTREEHWRRIYAEKEEDEVSWYQARPDVSLRLIAQTGISRDTPIIDAGGGASRLVDFLLDAGFSDITVLDIAATAIARSRQRLGARAARVRWIVADLLQWRPDRPHGLWHDRAVFHFLTEAAQRARYVETLKRALRPGGHAIIATFALDGPQRCSGLAVMRHSPESIARELGAEFSLVEAVDEHHTTPAGVVQHFNHAVLRREG